MVNLDGSGNQAAWVGTGVDRVIGGAFSVNASTDFFVFDVSAENSSGVVQTALAADAAESSFVALAGATYFVTSDTLVGNSGSATANQIDVLANTDFTNAVNTYEYSTSPSPEYAHDGAIGNVNQVYIANGVDATFNSWQVDNSNGLTYCATPSVDNYSNIGGNSEPVVIYGADGTAPYFDTTTHTWVSADIAHSYLTVNVTNSDIGIDPPALDLTNIYTVAGQFGEIDVTINDTYNGANTIAIVDGSNPTDTAGADLLIVNADAPHQTFLFDNNDGSGWFMPTDTFNGNVFTTMDIENYVSNDYSPTFDKAGVPLSLGASIPGEANFTQATITDMTYFVIGASGDNVDGTTVRHLPAAPPIRRLGRRGQWLLCLGPAVAEFNSAQVDNSSAFVGFESAIIVDVSETASLNSQSGLVQEEWALGANGAIHISVNTNLALYFTDTNGFNITTGVAVGSEGNYPFGTENAVIKADPNFAAQGAVGSFIVGGATYGVGNEALLGSSGVDDIYAGTGTTTNGTTVAGLNTFLDGEGGTGTDAAGHVQVSTDLLQGANIGWATYLFDTVDVANPSATNGQGPNTEILMDGTTGFAVTDDTINGTANSGVTNGCQAAAVFNQIDVRANTDFTGASINLTGGSQIR